MAMSKSGIGSIMVLGLLLLAAVMLWAKVLKYEFREELGGDTVIIEAGSKETGGGSHFTNCSYFSEAWEYLGQFEGPTPDLDPTDASAVENFCVSNFDNRQ